MNRRFRARSYEFEVADRALVMGILNVTPDSFYDRGKFAALDAACARARELAAQGAHILDVGGRSYASFNPIVGAEEEVRRVLPVVEALVAEGIAVPLSIDTPNASVAEAVLAAGASLINDCSGMADPRMAQVVAHHGGALVVMHLRGALNVRTPEAYVYDDPIAEIRTYLEERANAAVAAGVDPCSIVVDPGLEFGKEPRTDLEILDRLGELSALPYTLLLAASRKSFMGRIFNRPARDLLPASLAAAAIGIAAGARIVRAHDVAETLMLADMMAATRPAVRDHVLLAAEMPHEQPAAAVRGRT